MYPSRRAALAALAIALLAAGPLGARTVQNFYRVLVRNEDEFNRVLHQGAMVVLSKANEYVDIVAAPSEAEQLRESGLPVELVQQDLDGCVERMRERPELGAYHGFDKMRRELNDLAREHPDLVSVESIGDSWETQRHRADRQLLAVRVATPAPAPGHDTRPEVLFFGAIHSREIATTEVLLSFIQYLVEHRGSDPLVDFLITHRQLWFIPSINPDGREYALRSDIWWRKNRREYGATGSVGVDLNRNFGFHWGDEGHGGGSSADPHSAIYRGERPFSEPETQQFRAFVKRHHFIASLAYHSYGGYLLYPYGFTTQPAEDRAAYDDLAAEMARLNHYQHGNVRQTVGYFSSGRHDDWLYGDPEKPKVMALEIELGRTFFPDQAELPHLFNESLHTNLTLARRAGADPEIAWESSSSRMLQVRVANRGLLALKNFEMVLVGPDGRPTSEPKRMLRMAGALDREPSTERATFLFPLPGSEGSARATLRVTYLDGGTVRREIPITLPTD